MVENKPTNEVRHCKDCGSPDYVNRITKQCFDCFYGIKPLGYIATSGIAGPGEDAQEYYECFERIRERNKRKFTELKEKVEKLPTTYGGCNRFANGFQTDVIKLIEEVTK